MDDINIHVKDEEIIEKILIEEFRKNHKNNKYYFEKIGLNDYLYNNIKIKAIIDKDGDIKIIIDENNDEYYLDDFIKIFSEDENDNENEYDSSGKKVVQTENLDIDIIKENKDIIENINKVSNINNISENKGENEQEKNKENRIIEKNDLNNNNENGMKKEDKNV